MDNFNFDFFKNRKVFEVYGDFGVVRFYATSICSLSERGRLICLIVYDNDKCIGEFYAPHVYGWCEKGDR